jgi:hypothetical protein
MKQFFSAHLPGWGYRIVLLTMLLAVSVIASVFSLATNAQAATQASQVVVLDALHPGESASQVLSSQYVMGNQPLAAAAKSTLIIKLFPDNNWKGVPVSVYGSRGTCSETVSYGMPNSSLKHVHSFYSYGGCRTTAAYTQTNYKGRSYEWDLYSPKYVGEPWRSHFSSFISTCGCVIFG